MLDSWDLDLDLFAAPRWLGDHAKKLLPTFLLLPNHQSDHSVSRSISRRESFLQSLNTKASFILSNNLASVADEHAIYEWIERQGYSHLLEYGLNAHDATSKAMLENIFRLAVERDDCAVVEILMHTRINVTGHQCRVLKNINNPSNFTFTLDPLHLALLRNNVPLTKILLKAGILNTEKGCVKPGERSQLFSEQPANTHTLASMAIHGAKRRWCLRSSSVANVTRFEEHYSPDNEAATLQILELLKSSGIKFDHQSYYHHSLGPLIEELPSSSSLLVLAAEYRLPTIVEFLIHQAQDEALLLDRALLAIHTCLFHAFYQQASIGNYPLANEALVSPGAEDVTLVVRQLLRIIPGGGFDIAFRFEKFRKYFTTPPSLLDLAVGAKCSILVDRLLLEGYVITPTTLETVLWSGDITLFGTFLEHSTLDMTWSGMQLLFTKKDAFQLWMTHASLAQLDTATICYMSLVAVLHDCREIYAILQTNDWSDLNTLRVWADFKTASEERRANMDQGKPSRSPLGWDIFGIEQYANCKYEEERKFDASRQSLRESFYYAAQTCDFELLEVSIETEDSTTNSLIASCLNSALCGRIQSTLKCFCTDRHFRKPVDPSVPQPRCAGCRRGLTVVEKLLRLGAKVNDHPPRGKCFCRESTLLIASLKSRDTSLIKLLIDSGADCDARGFWDHNYRTPVEIASALGGKQLATWVMEYTRFSRDDKFTSHSIDLMTHTTAEERFLSVRAFWKSIRDGNSSLFNMLLHNGPDTDNNSRWRVPEDNKNLQHWLDILTHTSTVKDYIIPRRSFLDIAIRTGNDDIVQRILAQKVVDLNYWDDQNHLTTSLMQALYRWQDSNELELVESLLLAGADPNKGGSRSVDYFTLPLHVAMEALSSTKLLLKFGANPNRMKVDPDSGISAPWTPLHRAIYGEGFIDGEDAEAKEARLLAMVSCLLEHGADVNPLARELEIEPSLDTACITCYASEDETGEMVDDMCPHCIPRTTPLQLACLMGYKTITDLLLRYGADGNAPADDDAGATALQHACLYGYLEIVLLLIEHDVDVNAPGAEIDGRTALEAAAEHGRLDIVQLLLNAGAEVHGEGQVQYERACEYATNNGHHALRELLEEHHDAGNLDE